MKGRPVSNQQQKRVWLCVSLGLIAVIILLLTNLHHPILPKGIVLPAKKTLTPRHPSQVMFYQGLASENQKLGYVNIELHAYKNQNPKEAEQAVLSKARKLAASVGANGIIVNQFFRTSAMSTPSALALYIFNGEAVYVTGVEKPLALAPSMMKGGA